MGKRDQQEVQIEKEPAERNMNDHMRCERENDIKRDCEDSSMSNKTWVPNKSENKRNSSPPDTGTVSVRKTKTRESESKYENTHTHAAAKRHLTKKQLPSQTLTGIAQRGTCEAENEQRGKVQSGC